MLREDLEILLCVCQINPLKIINKLLISLQVALLRIDDCDNVQYTDH